MGVRIETQRRLMAGPGPGNGLPLLGHVPGRLPQEDLDLIGSGAISTVPTLLPYDSQDSYTREASETVTRVAVLENEHLRAEILLDLGARLIALVDKASGANLLHEPTPLVHGNLALRNAWFAGGVEWNLGVTGHWGLTSEPVAAGVVETEWGAGVRVWEYERMLGLTWRIDFLLPPGARALAVHPRVSNGTHETVPVYWWSNAAVPLTEGTRVIVPAQDAWWHGPLSAGVRLGDVPGEPDITYPFRFTSAYDHFFRTRGEHPWMAAVDDRGAGILQVSTGRLPSRKLFRWGEGRGGRRWQRWLDPEGTTPGYLEIQAGLAPTQLEHLPLRPGETWAWTEAWGPTTLDPALAHGAWDRAREAGERAASELVGWLVEADAVLDRAADVEPAVERVPSGWGALQEAAGQPPQPGTPYPPSSLGEAQAPWLSLVREGELPGGEAMPVPLVGEPWRTLLAGRAGWRELYLSALAEAAAGDTDAARSAASASLEERVSWQALRALAYLTEDPAESAELSRRAWLASREGADPAATRRALLVEALRALSVVERWEDVRALVSEAPADLAGHPRVRYAQCAAAVALRDVDTARRLLVDDVLEIPDVREGEVGHAELWDSYQQLVGTDEPLPAHYDFRMH